MVQSVGISLLVQTCAQSFIKKLPIFGLQVEMTTLREYFPGA
jgi:hypothetical protein